MFFDDFFGLLGSKKPIFTPDPKNFYFCPYVWSLKAAYILPKNPKIYISAFYDFISSFSTPGMGLNHVLMIFSESWDDFRWNLLFYKIFSTFMVPGGI